MHINAFPCAKQESNLRKAFLLLLLSVSWAISCIEEHGRHGYALLFFDFIQVTLNLSTHLYDLNTKQTFSWFFSIQDAISFISSSKNLQFLHEPGCWKMYWVFAPDNTNVIEIFKLNFRWCRVPYKLRVLQEAANI